MEKETLEAMVEVFREYETEHKKGLGIGGRKSLCPEDKVLLMLSYYREYRTLAHIGFDYGVSESTTSRIVREVEEVLGYLGIKKRHANCEIPYKASKLHPLSDAQKEANKAMAAARICVEHVNAKIKTFQIMAQTYRNRRKRFNLICGLINYDRGFQVA